MSEYPVLYSFRRCPYAMRSRMALIKAGIVCELREVILRNKPAEMLELSPKGTVPVLQLVNGTVLEESLDIMYWALKLQDPDGWLEPKEKIESLVSRLDKDFKGSLDKYKYFVRFPEFSQQHYREEGEQFLKSLDDMLSENDGVGLCDSRTTLADIAAFPFVRQFAFVDKPWFDQVAFRSLHNWLSVHLSSPIFQRVMGKYKAWGPGEPLILFGTAEE